MLCAFQTLEFFIPQFHIQSLRERYTDSWGRLLVSTYSISVNLLCCLVSCSSSFWCHTRHSLNQQSDAEEIFKKLICPMSSVCISTVHFQCRSEGTCWTREKRDQPAGLVWRVVRPVLYRPSMEIQCQRSCPQKRTGEDDLPLWKVSRDEEITGCSSNSVHQKEQTNLGMFTRDDNKIPQCETPLVVLLVSLFILNKMWELVFTTPNAHTDIYDVTLIRRNPNYVFHSRCICINC